MSISTQRHRLTAYSSQSRGLLVFQVSEMRPARYWSKDGRAHTVNPKGNSHTVRGRLRCDTCGMECRIRSGHYWECPKCRKRFRNIKGRAVPTVPGLSAVRQLPFLRDRKCPNCGNSHLCIKAIPRPPKVRYFYFRCSSCSRSCRFDQGLGRLVLLRIRRRHTPS